MISNLLGSQPAYLADTWDGVAAAASRLPELATGTLQSMRDAVVPETAGGQVRLMLGPWLKTYGIGSDTSPRIDDAPGFSARLGGPFGSGRHWGDPAAPGSPASREGRSLIGVELGLARFLALDLEAVSKLGRGYLAGSVDFAKIRAEIFGDVILDAPGIEFTHWRYTGDPGFEFGLRLGAQVLFELIGAHYEIGYDSPPIPMFGRELPVELTGRLDAAVHAFARAYAECSVGTRNAAFIGGKAFAGASTTVAGQAELASLGGAHGSVTAWAGAGAEFSVGVVADFEKREFGVQNSAGAAVGVGASYDYGVTVHAGEIAAESGLAGPLMQILQALAGRVADAGHSALTGKSSPTEFAGELTSATARALGEAAVAVEDSLPK